jgi:hypothetical protein
MIVTGILISDDHLCLALVLFRKPDAICTRGEVPLSDLGSFGREQAQKGIKRNHRARLGMFGNV